MLKTAIDGETNLVNNINTESEVVTIEGEMSLDNQIDGESGLGSELDGDSDNILPVTTSDHDQLSHRDFADQHPINAITGLQTVLDNLTWKCNTCDYWDRQRLYIPKYKEIIIYEDYSFTTRYGMRVRVPNFKVGDGTTYLIDLPFIEDDLRDSFSTHVRDYVAHVTSEERSFWNNKINIDVNPLNEELILNRN